jgi:hypothetical protein
VQLVKLVKADEDPEFVEAVVEAALLLAFSAKDVK